MKTSSKKGEKEVEERREKFSIFGKTLRILHVQIKKWAIKKTKFMFLFLFGFSPNIRHGDRLIVFGSSPWLIPHCLNPCQKEVDTSQVQKRWMRVSLSFWQKVHCSLSFRPILVRKLFVANLLCNSLN